LFMWCSLEVAMKRFMPGGLLWTLLFLLVPAFIFPSLSQAQSDDDVKKLIGRYNQLYKEGRYREAIPLAERVLAIRETSLGPEHPDTASTLNNVAELYRAAGDFAKAEPLHKRSLAIREKVLGPEHPDTATSLNNLAILYRAMGDYARAESLYGRALGVCEKVLGPEHPNTATSLNNLADLYRAMGEFAKAEPLYRRSLAIREKARGPEHPETAASLNNLAHLYYAMGDLAKAEPLLKRSLVICEKVLGPEHPNTAQSLNNLAHVYKAMGDLAKAEPLYGRSLAICEKVLGPEHPDTAQPLNNLAGFYVAMGDLAKAEALLKRSLAIREKTLSPDHPHLAESLNNLAVLYERTGDFAKAEPLCRRALAIMEKVLGPDHPDTAATLGNLAKLHVDAGRYRDALPLLLRSQGIEAKLIDQVMGFTSEDQKMKFLATKAKSLYGFLSLVALYFRDDRGTLDEALTIWLQRKGVVLEAQKRFQDALTLSDDPKITRKAQELARIRAQLSKLTFSGPGTDGADAYRKKMGELQARKEKLEADLSKISDAFAKTRKVGKADTKQVAGALPKGSVLIDFVKLPMLNLAAKDEDKNWLPPRYFAFILPSGGPGEVSFTDLGDAGEIDHLVGEFKKNVTNYQGDPEGKEVSRISRRLYDHVFSLFVKELKGAKDIYISPDGNLNLIPFEVLRGPDGRYLIEDYTFNYLGSGRDILGFGMMKAKPSKPLIMGDPDYDLDEKGQKDSLQKLGITPGKRSFVTRSRDLSSKGFSPLPGTRQEVESITSLLGKAGTSLYMGRDALEEVLMKHQNPKVLHLATHGFFLTDQDLLDETRKIPYENPLVRSGIVLAGVNKSMKSGSDEGIITAEKILSLRLYGTDMVVLSACETGLGGIKSGEGVFGLRRAFTQAGTKGIVMSMWSVPDRETKELMVNFYTNILVKKMRRPEALRQAMLTELSEVRKRYGSANPFFWGAFVYLGEP
jgi:CHAT domain-containing protein/tetratricopeptide (TPR) repeat protein